MITWRNAREEDGAHLQVFAGRWVALLDGKVIAQGGTPEQVYQFAKQSRYREKPELIYIPMESNLLQSEFYNEIQRAIPPDVEVYVVGGAVRDALLGMDSHDIDFAVGKDALKIARKVANYFDGAYFPLDTERGIGRVILEYGGKRSMLDFTLFRGDSLEEDLMHRDFTINAIAVRLDDNQALYDPLGGVADLHKKRLAACSPSSLSDDPIRILRAVRLAASLSLHIDPQARKKMRANAPSLRYASPERVRDEIFRIMESGKAAVCLRALEVMGVLEYVLPEPLAGKDVQQSPPHRHSVWEHTLETIRVLEIVLNLLQPGYNPKLAENAALGYVQLRLGRFREQFAVHLGQNPVPERTVKPLLILAALYHDSGKPETAFVDENGRIRFFTHEHAGKAIVGQRASSLMLSKDEVHRLETIVANHMRPAALSHDTIRPSRRSVYRFFRDTKSAGVDVCLLSIADMLAAYGPAIPQDRWERHLDVLRILLEAWWDKPEEQVHPEPLINGYDLMEALQIPPGPVIGELLERVIEAQVSGEIANRQEALDYSQQLFENKNRR